MSRASLAPKYKPGDRLEAKTVNEIIDVVLRKERSEPIYDSVERYIGVATTNFAPRSGATPGSGSVELYYIDSSGQLATTGVTVTAYNVSSTIMTDPHSIVSGKYCWAMKDVFGNWFVAPLEC